MRMCLHGVEDDGTPRTLVADIDMNGQDRQSSGLPKLQQSGYCHDMIQLKLPI